MTFNVELMGPTALVHVVSTAVLLLPLLMFAELFQATGPPVPPLTTVGNEVHEASGDRTQTVLVRVVGMEAVTVDT